MVGIKLQLLCGVRIELAVGSLPLSGSGSVSVQVPSHTTFYVHVLREEGVLQTCQPLGLEAEPQTSGPTHNWI